VLARGLDHLSLYQLTIEPGTAFARQAERGTLAPPCDDLAADMYAATQAMTAEAGLEGYEISNHARGREHRSVHNMLYWTGADWIGIGPGAHSRLGTPLSGGRLGASAAARPEAYIAGVETGTAHAFEPVSPLEDAQERVLMGLRLKEGLDRARLRAATGHDIDAGEAERLADQGLVETGPDRVRLSQAGRLYADGIAVALAPS